MRYKIAIYGSAIKADPQVIRKAQIIGEELSKQKVIIITGACRGIPYAAVKAASKNSQTQIWGFSPGRNSAEQDKLEPDCDNSIYTKLFYAPQDFPLADNYLVTRKYRNIISTASCDAGMIISGRWGTMNEFTCLYDMGKVIGVLTGSGGIADELPKLVKKISKKTQAKIFFNSNPQTLINQIIAELNNRYSSKE